MRYRKLCAMEPFYCGLRVQLRAGYADNHAGKDAAVAGVHTEGNNL